MQDFKISLITVCYNAAGTIEQCIQSVIAQDYKFLEYIIIDGGSTDGTLQIIEKYQQHISLLVSEYDEGIYDAMNKGIDKASGAVIGTLNADDAFADQAVLRDIASAFKQQDADIIYGDLNYVNTAGRIIRKWRSDDYEPGAFNWGWMPPHPTFYCKRQLFEKFGKYDRQYGTAADYELMLRFMHLNKTRIFYLKRIVVNMKTGGVSNLSFTNRLKAWKFDLKAMRKNAVFIPVLAIIIKPMRKIRQYF